jgi:hypothetical protein
LAAFHFHIAGLLMSLVQQNAKLNQILIELGRSLLQYVGHCSSWSSRTQATLEQEFPKLVAIQQGHVAQLSTLLTERRWPVDFGGFPATYTDLHFLSLSYLSKLILKNQQAIIAHLEQVQHELVEDLEVATLVEEVLSSERQLTARLQELTSAGSGAAA